MFSFVKRYPLFRKAVIAAFSVPLMFTSGAFLGDIARQQTVGEVGDLNIPRSEFTAQYQSLAERYRSDSGNDTIPNNIHQYIVQQVQNNLLSFYLINAAAKSKGIRAPDAVVAKTIREIPDFQDDDGRFDIDLYEEHVHDRRYYQERVRNSVNNEPLFKTTAAFPISDIRAALSALRRQKRTVDETTIAGEILTAILPELTPNITTEDINQYYQNNIAEFTITEEADFEYFITSLSDFAATVTVSKDDTAAAYEEYLSEWDDQRRMQVRHIYLEDSDTATEIYNLAVAAPDDFAELAKQHSQDAGSAADGGMLGIVTDGDLPEELNETLLTMTAGQIEPPIETDDGFSILKLDSLINSTPPPLEEVKAQMRERAKRTAARDSFEEKAEELSELALLEIGSLQNVAAAAGVSVSIAAAVQRNPTDNPAPFDDEAVLIDAFDSQVTDDRENSSPIPFGDDSYLFVRALRHQPAGITPLQTVSSDITDTLRAQLLATALHTRINNERDEDTEDADKKILPFLTGASWTSTHTVILANDEDDEGLNSINETAGDIPLEQSDDDNNGIDEETLDFLYSADLRHGLPAYVFIPDDSKLRIFRIRKIEAGEATVADNETVDELLATTISQLSHYGYLDELSQNYRFQFYDLPETNAAQSGL